MHGIAEHMCLHARERLRAHEEAEFGAGGSSLGVTAAHECGKKLQPTTTTARARKHGRTPQS